MGSLLHAIGIFKTPNESEQGRLGVRRPCGDFQIDPAMLFCPLEGQRQPSSRPRWEGAADVAQSQKSLYVIGPVLGAFSAPPPLSGAAHSIRCSVAKNAPISLTAMGLALR
jgi:hypothetical protein